jgi:hypothetical protein
MRVTSLAFPLFLLAACASAQVLSPEEIRDPNLRELQKRYWGELKQISVAIYNHDFPYHFYFSRTLDLSEKDQHSSDQRSIQFDRYRDRTVLKITGNYFASYSAELMQPHERARQTYQEVMLPLLEAAVPAFATSNVPEAFAFEISHHVRKKMLGVSSEAIENVVLILPKESALRLMTATNAQAKQAAVSEGEAFLNAMPIELWPGFKTAKASPPPAPVARPPASAPAASLERAGPVVLPGARSVARIESKSSAPTDAGAAYRVAGGAGTSATQPGTTAGPERDSSPDALKNIQNIYQANLDRMVQELNAQAHFLPYAPPAFVPFHGGRYLQLSVTTTLADLTAGSPYKLAALAFDRHIAHLIRPTLEYVKADRGDFDGIDFSSSIRLGADKDSDGSTIAVEFILPLNALRTYEAFDVTGQQLIDSGFVLINGERVSLDLQIAEAASR